MSNQGWENSDHTFPLHVYYKYQPDRDYSEINEIYPAQ